MASSNHDIERLVKSLTQKCFSGQYHIPTLFLLTMPLISRLLAESYASKKGTDCGKGAKQRTGGKSERRMKGKG